MDTSIARKLLRHAAARPARRPAPATAPPPKTVFEEMWLGAAIGFLACLAFVWVAGGGPVATLAAAVLGLASGAVIGLVLWAGSAHLPEDPVLPVPPSQRRDRPEG